MTPRLSAVSVALAFLLGGATAQVRPGWYVTATFKTSNIPTPQSPFPGDGGLWFVHPRNPSVACIPVAPLSSDLTGAGTTGVDQGANCVSIRPDGSLAVGEITAPSGQVDLHILTLAEHVVLQDVTYRVGTAGVWGGAINQLALLSSGEILMSVWGLIHGAPLSGAPLARWSPATGAITPIPAAGLPGDINALALDPSGTTLYLGIFTNDSTGSIWRLPIAGGQATRIQTSIPLSGVMNLDIDNSGRLVAGCSNVPVMSDVYVIDPATGATTAIGAVRDVHNAIRVERATGNYAINRNSVASLTCGIAWMTPAGVDTVLSAGPSGGWGALAGVDIRHDPATYGPGTPGANVYAWVVAPKVNDPNALPLVGNSAFGLTIAAQPTMAPGVWLASAGDLVPSVRVLGLELNIQPAFVMVGVLGTTSPQRIPLPIPPDPNLVDLRLYFQTVHVEGSVFAASNGLAMTILQP